jgi:2-polyprenyl-3-methyl-5-hydroxy-6-metoxy-1,4-benzoquinol methylase
VFLHPRPPRELVENYFRDMYDDDYGANEASEDRQPVFQSVLEHLSVFRSSPGSLLDVGCGDGEFLTLCRQAGWDCSGIELSRQAVIRATQKGLTILPPQTFERSQWERRFDVVSLINVLETVADPLAMLRRAATFLAPRGLLIVRATNGMFHLPMRVPARWIGSRYDQAFHWYVYTAKALTTLMTQVGLVIISVRNSRLSRGPLAPVHPWFSRMKWAVGRTLLWPLAQTLYYATDGRLVCAPSFEVVAQRPRSER